MPDLVDGLGGDVGFGEGVLGRNDDSYTGAIDIRSIFGSSGLNFFGTHYTTLFVNNNGNITFGNPTGDYTPEEIGANLSFPIIAALWTDIDTRHVPEVDSQLSEGGTSRGTNLVYYDLDADNGVFTATWDDVDFYSVQSGHPAAFQIRLIDVGHGDFDIELIYENVVLDDEDYVVTSRAGYSPGQGHSGGDEIRISGTAQMANIDDRPGNTGEPGYYLFHVRGGEVTGGDDPPPIPPPPPRPVTVTVEQIGLIREGDDGATPVNVVISRSGTDLGNISVVDWRIDLADANDLAPGQPLSGSVTFAPYETTATMQVQVQGDTTFEDDEWFHFRLTQASFGAETWDPGVDRIGVIVNDDPVVDFQFASPVLKAEGLTGPTPFEFVVKRFGDTSEATTVNWVVQLDGAADAFDIDPNTLSGMVAFAAGQDQAVIRVNVLGDPRAETDETFTLRLTSSTTGTTVVEQDIATVATILNDDDRLSALVAAPSALVLPEGDSGTTVFSIQVMRVGDLAEAVTIPYAIAPNGGLGADEIQTALSGTVTFAAGSASATLSVAIAGDLTPEANESFLVTVGGGAFNTLSFRGIVINDDKAAAPSAESPGSSPLGDVSDFMSQLMGGGLWSSGLVL